MVITMSRGLNAPYFSSADLTSAAAAAAYERCKAHRAKNTHGQASKENFTFPSRVYVETIKKIRARQACRLER